MAGDHDIEAVKAQAREWVDRINSGTGLSGGWRLQVLQMRTRRKFDKSDVGQPGPVTDANGDVVSTEPGSVPASSGCADFPVRIRRFVSGCPWSLVDQAIRYLYEIAPYSGIVYNGVKLEGKYRPTLTQWMRDDQQTVAERGANGTYTLVQDLIEITDCDGSLGVSSGTSCSAYEETVYHWDEGSVEELPTDCEQGVMYSIRSVQRNEDGTFDYQLVKTVARTRHYGPVLVECNAQVEVTEERWESVYGSPDTGFEARGCDVSGAIETPACDTTPGVRTQVQYQPNADCTFDVVVRRRIAKQFSDAWREGTACRGVDVSVVRNSPVKIDPPVPGVGERVEHSLQRNEDDSYDATTRITRAPTPLVYSWRDGTSCRPREVTRHLAVTSRPSPPSIPAGGLVEAEVSRNEDCTWDARFAVTPRMPEFSHQWDEGSTCRPVHVEIKQNTATVPVVPTPRAGETVSVEISRNQDCTYDSRIRTVRPASSAVFEWDQGSVCRPEHITSYQRSATLPQVPPPGVGKTVQASISRNEDCTYDGQIRTVTSPESITLAWTDGTPCREIGHRVWQGMKSFPSLTERAVGRTVSASLRRNDDCTFDGSEEVLNAQAGSVSWKEGVGCRPTSSEMKWNQASVSINPPGTGETVSASVSRNPDCTYDYTVKRTPAPKQTQVSWGEGSGAVRTTTTLFDRVTGLPSTGQGGIGTTVRASFRRNEDCTFSGEVSSSSALGDRQQWIEGNSCDSPYGGLVRNAVSIVPPQGKHVSVSASANQDGTYDYSYHVRNPQPKKYEKDWESVEEGPTHKYTYKTKIIAFANQSDIPKPPAGSQVSASVHLNDDCTLSGVLTATWLKKWEKRSQSEESGYASKTITKEFTRIANGVVQKRKRIFDLGYFSGVNASKFNASQARQFDEIYTAAGVVVGVALREDTGWVAAA